MCAAGHEIDPTLSQTVHPADVVNCVMDGSRPRRSEWSARGCGPRPGMETLWKPQTAWKHSNPAAPEKNKLHVCGINRQTRIS
jgi:hypothetical protein